MTEWRLEIYDSLSSTSDACVGRAKAGEAAGLAILAHVQTDGRGSRGRHWQAPPGNLNLSVLLRPAARPAESGIFPLLAGLAAAEALASFLPPGKTTMLKWPNDILVGGAKLAGILIDAAPVQERLDWLVIGIGANLQHAPDLPDRATTSLAAVGGAATAPAAANAVLTRLSCWLGILSTSGPAPIRDAWLAAAHPLGSALEIRSVHGTKTGTFAGLSPTGALLLARGETIERIDTGEILLGPMRS